MQKYLSQLTPAFKQKTNKTIQISVPKSVSHFNWFARYDAANKTQD